MTAVIACRSRPVEPLPRHPRLSDAHLRVHKKNKLLFCAVTRLEEQLPEATVEVRAR